MSASVPLPARSRIIVFDVNETLLDIMTLEPLFQRLFGTSHAMREWFAQVILYSEVLTIGGLYEPFGKLGAATLRMLGEIKGVEITEKDIDALRTAMQRLPAHPDAAGALERLRNAGFRLVTLTNSAPDAAEAQMQHSGLGNYFERRFTVEPVRLYKPARETYQHVADTLGVDLSRLRMVAAHVWDTIGAQQAGCAAALVTRPGNAPLPIGPQPDIIGVDLHAVAERIIAVDVD
jgi:2-haloacid dehalogenase